MHFIVDLIAVKKDDKLFKDIDKMHHGEVWVSPGINSVVWADVIGENPFWSNEKFMKGGIMHDKYNEFRSSNLLRFFRDKWVHYYELDEDLQKVLEGSRYGLVKYCNSLVNEEEKDMKECGSMFSPNPHRISLG
jgi:hypothetical protein